MRLAELSAKVEGLEKKQEEGLKHDPVKFNDETRSDIAKNFVNNFFSVIKWSLFWVLLYNLIIVIVKLTTGVAIEGVALNVETILPIIISAIAGPLGFVVGYYFKSSQ